MMTVITRCPSCGYDVPVGDLDPVFVSLIGKAMIAGIEAAGLLSPERVERFERFFELVRSHHPRLRDLSDHEISVIIGSFGREPQPDSAGEPQ